MIKKTILFISVTLIFGLVNLTFGQDKSPKRGICGDASPEDLAVLAPYITWYYDWGVAPPAVSEGQLFGIEWVPMCWGGVNSGDVAGIEAQIPEGSKYLLGYNEPNFISQANLTPAQAASMWPNLEKIAADKSLELISPAVNWCGDCVEGVTNDPTDWLDQFFSTLLNCKVDYIAIHNYAPGSAAIKSYVEKFRKYNKPLWITEFAPWDPPKPDYDGVVQYMKEVIPFLENEPLIFRYSWFATRVGINPDISLLKANGTLTKLGQLYTSLSFQGLTVDIPPVAMAGSDIDISLPATGVKLKGSAYDANGDTLIIEWVQVSGPNTATFSNTAIAQPTVSDLIEGTYVFRITLMASGETDYDEASVSVGSTNIALNKPITASSVEGTTTPATGANDGNLATRWSSAFSDPQWIMIDLQSVYEITGAKIIWEAAASRKFEIQISENGITWNTVFSTTSGNGGTDKFTFSAIARYIRMYSTARTTEWGNSIYEFEVYGTMFQTGITNRFIEKSFIIYPNPVAGGIINISLGDNGADEDMILSITSISGQLIYSGQIHISKENPGDISISTDGFLGTGLYILSVKGRNITRYARLVITQ
jgi:hypothetical protein